MSYFNSLSYFSDNFEQRVADPAELGRQLFEHRMEADYIRAAIVELGTVAQFKRRARKLTPAAKTLAGETAISWLFGVGGRASWGEFALTVKRAHKMAGTRNDRVLRQLEDAGVIVCSYFPGESWDRSKPRPLSSVIVSLSYDLWLPAEIIPALPEAATAPTAIEQAAEIAALASSAAGGDETASAGLAELGYTLPTTKLSETSTYQGIVSKLEILDRSVRVDPDEFAADHLAGIERELRRLVEAVSEGVL